MPVKKRFLKKVNVDFISLVDKGANRKTIIFKAHPQYLPEWKGLSTGLEPYSKTISILKYDEDQHIVYGIVYSPDEPDTDGDFTSADVIKQMAYDFMKNRNTNNVDHQHDYNPDEGFIAESWLLEKNDPRFPDDTEGSWAVGIKVTNAETWKKIKSGEITGLSMAGVAVVEDVGNEPGIEKYSEIIRDSILERIAKALKEAIVTFKRDSHINIKNNINKEEDMTTEVITNFVESKVADAVKPFEELQKSLSELKNLLENKSDDIEKRLSVVEKLSPGSSQLITHEEIFKNDKSYKGPAWLS